MKQIFIVAAKKNQAKKEIVSILRQRTKLVNHPSEADLILVLGGDGTMLKTIKQYGVCQVPFCGLNFGHIGFLMNEPKEGVIDDIINGDLNCITVPLIKATLYEANNKKLQEVFALNDIFLDRSSSHTAKIKITIDNIVVHNPLIADGVIVCSAAGSTAYNASAGGMIIPIETNSMIITGICPAIFNKWRCTQLSADSVVILEAKELEKRPVRLVADGEEIPLAVKAKISYCHDHRVTLAFVKSQDFQRKVLDLQFNR